MLLRSLLAPRLLCRPLRPAAPAMHAAAAARLSRAAAGRRDELPSARWTSTRTAPTEMDESAAPLLRPVGGMEIFVEALNQRLRRAPFAAFWAHTGLQLASFGVVFTALKPFNFAVPEMVVALAIASPIKRLRLPLDVATAAVFANLFPVLTRVEMMALINPHAHDQAAKGKVDENGAMSRVIRVLEGPVNKYGAALLLARVCNGLATFTAVTVLLKMGMDMGAVLEWLNVSPETGNTAGAMALTAVINTVTLPVRLMALPQAVDLWLEYRRRQQPQEPAGDSGTAGQDPEPPPIRAS